MMQAIVHICDNCPATYTLPLNYSYDPKNYAGTGWARIRVEGKGIDVEICPECANWIEGELMLSCPNLKLEEEKHANAKAVATKQSSAKESR